jgi:hypothetical protein
MEVIINNCKVTLMDLHSIVSYKNNLIKDIAFYKKIIKETEKKLKEVNEYLNANDK